MLRVSSTCLDEIKRSSEFTAEECCGFMVGHTTPKFRVVTQILAVPNASPRNKRVSFEIAPTDYLFAENFAEQSQLQLLGIYHSHPEHSAFPSTYDQQLALPTFSYVIVSTQHGKVADIRSWRLNELHTLEEEPLVLFSSPCTY